MIASAAAERFESQQGRRVTEGTLGAVIQIIDYEIVAQHHGPKRTKITMLINNFRHIGSDGSAPFGTPCSIECQPPIIGLLGKLQTLRSQEHSMSQSPASLKPARGNTASPSQTTSVSSTDDNIDRTQTNLATQIPRFQSRKRLREGSYKPTENQPSVPNESDSGRSRGMIDGDKVSSHALDLGNSLVGGAGRGPPIGNRQALVTPADSHKKLDPQANSKQHSPEPKESGKVTNIAVEGSVAKRSNDLLNLLARNSNNSKSNFSDQEAVVKHLKQAKQTSQDPIPRSAAAIKDTLPVDTGLQKQATPVTFVPSEPQQKSSISPTRGFRVLKPAQRDLTKSQNPQKPARQLRQVRRPSRLLEDFG